MFRVAAAGPHVFTRLNTGQDSTKAKGNSINGGFGSHLYIVSSDGMAGVQIPSAT